MSKHAGEVRFALIAEHVVVADGMFQILNAGWTEILTPTLPAQASVQLAAQLIGVPWETVIQSELRAPDGEVLVSTSTLVMPPTAPGRDDTKVTTNLALDMPFVAMVEGEYSVVLSGEAIEDYTISFSVRLAQS